MPADSYHHGTLHAALIDAAEALLRENGLEAFTLRECARRAGVSHAAPAHHFGDARGLLSACAARAFERMVDGMQQQMASAPIGDAVARLAALGQGYIDFALANRALFQLMFRRDRLDPEQTDLRGAGRRTGDLMRDAIDAVLAERRIPAEQRGERILLAWSLVHGFATLVIEDQTRELFGFGSTEGRPDAAAMGAALLKRVMTGLAAP